MIYYILVWYLRLFCMETWYGAAPWAATLPPMMRELDLDADTVGKLRRPLAEAEDTSRIAKRNAPIW